MPSAIDLLSQVLIQAAKCSKETITQIGHGFVASDAIRWTGSAWTKAQADNASNAEASGVVESINGNAFTIVYGGKIEGLSGLTTGAVYFLSDVTPGALTTTEPTTAGTVSKPMLFALSSTTGVVLNYRGLLLGNSGVVGMTYVHQQAVAASSWNIQHNLNTLDVMIQCYDAASGNLIYPTTVDIVDGNNLVAYFGTASAGKAMVVALLGTSSGYQRGVADVRLDYLSTTTIELKDIDSGKIEVNGEIVDCIAHKVLSKTDNLITATGANAGSAMSVSTFYYCYVSNSLATYAPLALRASATAPTNGYLGASGNAANWRYVGDCYLWSDGFFYDDELKRLVRSQFNTLWKGLRAYNTTSTWVAGGGPREFNNGTGMSRGYFIGDGKNAINIVFYAEVVNGTQNWDAISIGLDSTTTYLNNVYSVAQCNDPSYGQYLTISGNTATLPSAGLHYLTLIERSNGAGSLYGFNTNTQANALSTLVPC